MQNQMGMPQAAPKKSNNTTIIIVVAVLVLCCCCLAAASVFGWYCGDWMMGTAASCSF